MLPEERERKTALMKKLAISGTDLEWSLLHAQHLLDNGWYHAPAPGNRTNYVQQAAFVTSFVAAYGRVFTRAENVPDFPMRLAKFSPDQKALHEWLLKRRDSQYAHSDGDLHKLSLDGDKGVVAIHEMPAFVINKADLELFVTMTKKLLEAVFLRRWELHEELKPIPTL